MRRCAGRKTVRNGTLMLRGVALSSDYHPRNGGVHPCPSPETKRRSLLLLVAHQKRKRGTILDRSRHEAARRRGRSNEMYERDTRYAIRDTQYTIHNTRSSRRCAACCTGWTGRRRARGGSREDVTSTDSGQRSGQRHAGTPGTAKFGRDGGGNDGKKTIRGIPHEGTRAREQGRARRTGQAEEKESGARNVCHGKQGKTDRKERRATRETAGPHPLTPPHPQTPIIEPQTRPICSGPSPHVGATSDV